MGVSKYKNKKVEIDGLVFDSIKEGEFYTRQVERLKAGCISSFVVHPVYELQPKFQKNGKNYRAIMYEADFEITEKVTVDGIVREFIEVIDIKGLPTEGAKLKRKMFDFKYPEKCLTWLAWSKIDGGWIEYDQLVKNRARRKKEKKGGK